jgi:ABC-2 type transport system permease protein
MKLRRLMAIVVKELRQLRRDRLTLGMVIGIPILQLLLFGFAINLDVRHLPAAIADEANTSNSRAFVQDLFATDVIVPVATARNAEELSELLRRGEINVGVWLPHDFERRRIEGREAVQILVDGSDSVVYGVARQLSQLPLVATAGRFSTPRETPVGVVGFYNPERRSAVNIVPGLIGVILTLTMVLFTAVAIVRERERGNMELLITTPLTRAELMIGKVLPYIALGLIQTTVILLLGHWIFALPMRGNLLDVYAASLLLIAANLSLGLLISTRAQSQFQAMQMTFFVFLPSILLSGFMFPFAGMPRFAQWIAEVLPLTHFIRLIRGVMLRGAELAELWHDVAALAAFSAIMMTLAILRFRKRLD